MKTRFKRIHLHLASSIFKQDGDGLAIVSFRTIGQLVQEISCKVQKAESRYEALHVGNHYQQGYIALLSAYPHDLQRKLHQRRYPVS